MIRRVTVSFTLLFCTVVNLGAQDNVYFGSSSPDERWTVTTRWDYRVRMDGKYLGFANRELREVYRRGSELPDGWEVEGEARLLGATRKNGMPVAARLEGSEDISYILSRNGGVLDAENGYPRLRGFPTFPEQELTPGDRWEAPLDILVSGPEGGRGVLNQIAVYQYLGMRPYGDRQAHYFDVNWAIRYDGYQPDIEFFLNRVEGSHKVSLIVDAETLAPIMARDSLSERWIWADSRVEQRDGFALIFWKGVPPLDKGSILDDFEARFPGDVTRRVEDDGSTVSDGNGTGTGMLSGGTEDIVADDEDSDLDDFRNDIVIVETPRGVSVTLRNLHFKPDLAELLSDDRPLLDELADILESIPGRTVLVRGHTADVGRPEDELNLSEERAHTVADEMAARGIDPGRLIFEGVGAQEPVASNSNEEGRRLNRRVELLILED